MTETNKDLADRLILEHQYDRPSFHCGHASCTVMGRLSAIMEQHIDASHPERRSQAFFWYDLHCTLCGFDVRLELHRLYPEHQGA